MTALGLFIGIVLFVYLVGLSVSVIKAGYGWFVTCLWIIAIMSMASGMCIEYDVSASDYLKSPESYQVDTFMINGVIDHYEVSNK